MKKRIENILMMSKKRLKIYNITDLINKFLYINNIDIETLHNYYIPSLIKQNYILILP